MQLIGTYITFFNALFWTANNDKTKFLLLFICSLLSTEQNHSMWLASLCVNSLGDSRAKPWTTLFYILGVMITKIPTNSGFQRVDTWIWRYVRLSLNDAKQLIVPNIQIWGAARPNILRDYQRKILLQEILNFLGSMRGRRVLNEQHFEGIVPAYPQHQNIFQKFKYSAVLILRPASMKWGGITLPSLATAVKTITEAELLLCITGGTSEGSKAITRVF